MLAGAIVVGIIILALIGFIVFVRVMNQVSKRSDTAEDPRVDSLYYVVPTGQDPAVLVEAMMKAGYESSADVNDGVLELVVNTPAGRDRERARVRQIIASASQASLEGPDFEHDKVLFTDEQGA